MRQALELAKRALGKTHPNPAVGCVLVRDGKASAEGDGHGYANQDMVG